VIGARRLFFSLLIYAAAWVSAWAQPTPAPSPPPTSTPSPTPDYQDRLIEGGNLAPQVSTGGTAESSSDGWPRAYGISVQGGTTTQNGVRDSFAGFTVDAQVDTPNYGAFTLNLQGRNNPGDVFGVIENRRLPLDGGWFASHALGVVNLQMPSAPRGASRYVLPGAPVWGATSRWEQLQRGIEIAGSVGQPGRFNVDSAVTGFERSSGRYAAAGAALNGLPVQAGATVFSARDVDDGFLQLKRADSLHLATAWRSGDTFAQVQAIGSRTDIFGNAHGAWLDAGLRTGAITHEAGVYRFEPNLTWGPLLTVGDIQGVHYRAGYRSRRWLWDASVEAFDSVSGTQPPGRFAALNTRYQYSRDLGFGGSLALRDQGTNAYAAAAFIDSVNALGNTRLQWDASDTQNNERTQRLALDQSFAGLPPSTRVSIGVGVESLTSPAGTERAALLNGLISYEPQPGIGLDAALRTRRPFDSNGNTANDASLSARWQINPFWQLSANYTASRGTFTQITNLDPLAPPLVSSSTSSSSTFLVALRYQEQAGRAVMPLGGRPGDGAGSVRGVLFLDENGNAKREAGEVGAANVTVVLDGRFSTRTNAQGAFEFAFVAAGEHSLTVVADNLPLPWFAPEAPIKFGVQTRGVTQLDVPAKK
jgi:hypothetical protein